MPSKFDQHEKYRLMRTPAYSALKLANGDIVAVIPNPNDLDCPDCLYCAYCTRDLGVDSKHIPCEARPDKLSCIYKIVPVVNQMEVDTTTSTGADSASTGD
jgi:hypothetical protein